MDASPPSHTAPNMSLRGEPSADTLGLSTPNVAVEPTPDSSMPQLLTNVQKAENNAFAPSAGYAGAHGNKGRRRKWIIAGVSVAALAVVVLAVVLPVYFVVVKPRQNSSNTATSSGSAGSSIGGGSSNPASPTGATSGGNGSIIILDDGSEFTYINNFGGIWVSDPDDPYNNNAQVNSWTPPLNQSWTWGQDKLYGVNLGGLFVLEPFITPSIFQKYPTAVDEWTLSEAMAADTASGGLDQLEDHYNTFITEKDIADIAAAGLNWIRVPIPFWAIDKWDGEPFLEGVSWKYILRLLQWARKYGLRVNLDLHTIPGSQNGYNHSGKLGQVDFMNGVMGVANAQRAMNYIRIITEFITQPEWANVIPMFGVVNEALVETIGQSEITTFYYQVHEMMRGITGLGEGHGPYMSIHDGFIGISNWAGFLPGSDRIIMDTHPYFAFDGSLNDAPIATGTGTDAGGVWPLQACNAWGPEMNTSQTAFGVSVAGEFSSGFNDCGLYLRGVGTPAVNPDCDTLWNNYTTWNESTIAGVRAFTEASMDTLQNWFFWTWKIGNSSTSNQVEAPLWSYSLGLQQGWIPADPRSVSGTCEALGATMSIFDGTYSSWATGGAGAGTIAATAVAEYGTFPPATIAGADVPATLLPTYTLTGSVATLSTLSVSTGVSVSVSEDGWFDAADTTEGPATITGCSYADAWDATGAALPTAACGTGTAATAVITSTATAR